MDCTWLWKSAVSCAKGYTYGDCCRFWFVVINLPLLPRRNESPALRGAFEEHIKIRASVGSRLLITSFPSDPGIKACERQMGRDRELVTEAVRFGRTGRV